MNAPSTHYPRCPTCKKDFVEVDVEREYKGSTLVREDVMCRNCETLLSTFDLTKRNGYFVETRVHVSKLKEIR